MRIRQSQLLNRSSCRLALFFLGVILSLVNLGKLQAQSLGKELFILDSLYLQQVNVADTAAPYELYEKLTNLPHFMTKESVIRRGSHLFFTPGDTVSPHNVDEFERYLRELGVFSHVNFNVDFGDTATSRSIHRILQAKVDDSWSLVVKPYHELGEDRTAWLLIEENLFGYAKKLGIGGDLLSPSDSTWRGIVTYRDPDFLGTSHRLESFVLFSQPLTRVEVDLQRPFYTDRMAHSWGGGFQFADGKDLFFFRNSDPNPDPQYFTDTNYSLRYDAEAWYGNSNREDDLFHASLRVDYNRYDLESGNPHPRAFENSFGLFGGIGSLRRDYAHLEGYEFSGPRLVPIGAQGRVSIGKIFPHSGGLDDLVYIGADVRKSMLSGDFYSFVMAEAGTGFQEKETAFTMFRATASGGLKLGPGVLAVKGQLSTIWRWPRYVLLPASQGDIGLRGYGELEVLGDNRLGFNVDYRLFPLIDLELWELGIAGFWDVVRSWNQAELFSDLPFHNGAGIGLRIGNSKSLNSGFIRVDFGWNFDRGALGEISFEISFSAHEAFDIFGTLDFDPPGVYMP
ncbi:MAG: hypothetical protein KDD67_05430 [Ignavibacteriae bacterium]|nr:hypothetical protein [Ignavibacteriota bacterium]